MKEDLEDNLNKFRLIAFLSSISGVGIKVANLAMYSCHGKIEGIGVDTHLNRILHRLKWCNEENREKQMTELESWLPKAMWWDLNEKLLGRWSFALLIQKVQLQIIIRRLFELQTRSF